MKQKIRINESQLRRIVAESVKSFLIESSESDPFGVPQEIGRKGFPGIEMRKQLKGMSDDALDDFNNPEKFSQKLNGVNSNYERLERKYYAICNLINGMGRRSGSLCYLLHGILPEANRVKVEKNCEQLHKAFSQIIRRYDPYKYKYDMREDKVNDFNSKVSQYNRNLSTNNFANNFSYCCNKISKSILGFYGHQGFGADALISELMNIDEDEIQKLVSILQEIKRLAVDLEESTMEEVGYRKLASTVQKF